MGRGWSGKEVWLAVVLGTACRGDDDNSQSAATATDGGISTLSGTAVTDANETTDPPRLDVANLDVEGGSAGEGGQPETCKLVDVVLSVDNSGSMSEEIEALRGPVFDSFPQTLLDVGNGLDDFHLAVIDACNDPPFFHDWGDDGDCNFPGDVNFMSSTSPTLTDEYSCVTNLTTSGYKGMADNCSGSNDDEQPANTAADAVSQPAIDGANSGFLREDAVLFIVAITDEDEQPVPAATPDEIAAKIIAAKGTIDNVVFLGIGGDSDCDGPYGGADEAEVLREVTQIFVDADRGLWWDLCQGDLETAFATALTIVDSACIEFNPPG
jgi:hypothetical protein